MNDRENDTFYIEHHRGLTDDLNQISNGLKRANWLFLASIAAIGTAYAKIYSAVAICSEQKFWATWAVCLVGNIVFWLITEYALSHGFLFRFIQSQLARIETKFGGPEFGLRVKDPTDHKEFIEEMEDKKLRIRHEQILPDQFVPIYWASTWLILINSAISFCMEFSYEHYSLPKSLWLNIVISAPLIWKLWTYYGYKIDKFLHEHCHLEFVVPAKRLWRCNLWPRNEHYFTFPVIPSLVGLASATILYDITCIPFTSAVVDWNWFMFWASVGYFFPVPLGIFLHVLHTILRLDLHKMPILRGFGAPQINKGGCNKNNDKVYTLKQWPCFRILTVLYRIL